MIDERELVQRVKDGDQNAFRELVERYKKQIYYLALDLTGDHHDAEDVSQEVFIKVYRGIGKFRYGSKLGTWLHRITVNAYLDSKRKKSFKMVSLHENKQESGTTPLDVPADGQTANPDLAADSADVGEHIRRALEGLSEHERAVFVLRHYHDLSLKEISTTMNIAEGTVKSHLFRSVRKLRDRLSYYKQGLGLED